MSRSPIQHQSSQLNAFLTPKEYYKMTNVSQKDKKDIQQQNDYDKKKELKQELVMMKRQAKTINQLLGEDTHKKNKMELNKINWYYKKSFNKNKDEKYLEFQGIMNKLVSNIKSSEQNLKEMKKKNNSFRIEDPKSFTISEINQKLNDKQSQKKGFLSISSRDLQHYNKQINKNKATLSHLPLTDQDDNDEDQFDENQLNKSTDFKKLKKQHNYATTYNVIKSQDMMKKNESTDRQVDFAKFNNIISQTQELCQEIVPCIKQLAKTKKVQDKQFKTDKIRLIEVLRSPNYINQKNTMRMILNEREELHPYLRFLGYDNIEQIPNLAKRPRMEIIESRYLYSQYLSIEKKSFQKIKEEQILKDRNSISTTFEKHRKSNFQRSFTSQRRSISSNNQSIEQSKSNKLLKKLNLNNLETQNNPNSSRFQKERFISSSDRQDQYIDKKNSQNNKEDSNFLTRDKQIGQNLFQNSAESPKRTTQLNSSANKQTTASFTSSPIKINSQQSSPKLKQVRNSLKQRQAEIYPKNTSEKASPKQISNFKDNKENPNFKSNQFQEQDDLDKFNFGYQSVSDRFKRRGSEKQMNTIVGNIAITDRLNLQDDVILFPQQIQKKTASQKFNENTSPLMFNRKNKLKSSCDPSFQAEKKFQLSQQNQQDSSILKRRYSSGNQKENTPQSKKQIDKHQIKLNFFDQENNDKDSENIIENFSNYLSNLQNKQSQNNQDVVGADVQTSPNKKQKDSYSQIKQSSNQQANNQFNHPHRRKLSNQQANEQHQLSQQVSHIKKLSNEIENREMDLSINQDQKSNGQKNEQAGFSPHLLKLNKSDMLTPHYRPNLKKIQQVQQVHSQNSELGSIDNQKTDNEMMDYKVETPFDKNTSHQFNLHKQDQFNEQNTTKNAYSHSKSNQNIYLNKSNYQQQDQNPKSRKDTSQLSTDAKSSKFQQFITQRGGVGGTQSTSAFNTIRQKNLNNNEDNSVNQINKITQSKKDDEANNFHQQQQQNVITNQSQNSNGQHLLSNRHIQVNIKGEKQHEVADIFNAMTLQDLNIMRKQAEGLKGKNNEIFNAILGITSDGENKFNKGFQQIKREMLTYQEQKDNIVDSWEKKQLLQKQKNRQQIKDIIRNHYEEQQRVEEEQDQQNLDQMDQLIGTNYYYNTKDNKMRNSKSEKNINQKLSYEQLKLKNMKLIKQAKSIAAQQNTQCKQVGNQSSQKLLFQSQFSQQIQHQIRQIAQSENNNYDSNKTNPNPENNFNSLVMNQTAPIFKDNNQSHSNTNNDTQNYYYKFNQTTLMGDADDTVNKNNSSLINQFQNNNYSSVTNFANLTSINNASQDQIISITDRNIQTQILNKIEPSNLMQTADEARNSSKEVNNNSMLDSFLVKQIEGYNQNNQAANLHPEQISEEGISNNDSYNKKLNSQRGSQNNLAKQIINKEKRNVSLKLLKEKQQQKYQIKDQLQQVLTRFNRIHSNQSDLIMKKIIKYRKQREKNQALVDFDQMNNELQRKQNEFLLIMEGKSEEMLQKKKREDILWQTQQRIYSNKKFDPTKFYRDELNWKNTIDEATEFTEGLEGHLKKARNTLNKAQKQSSPNSQQMQMTPAQSFIQQVKKKIGFKEQ